MTPARSTPSRRRPAAVLALAATLLLGGCQWLGIESPEALGAAKQADGEAIGGACRHAGRALEDCYLLNPKAQRAAVFAGWREMDEYMRENKLEAIAPTVPRPGSRQAETAEATPPAPASPPAEGPDAPHGAEPGAKAAPARKTS